MPDVKVGSVIEIRYKIVSPFTKNINNIQFQYDIPVNKLEYSAIIPGYYEQMLTYKGEYLVEPTTKTEDVTKNVFVWLSKKERFSALNGVSASPLREQVKYKRKILEYKADDIPALALR